MDLSALLRPHLQHLHPYSSARDEFSGQAKIFLDANENSFGSTAGNSFHRYPDPYQSKLKHAISGVKGVPMESIFLGNGSDEPIDLLIRAFCRPGEDAVLTMPPTYGMYQVSAEINGVRNIEVPLGPDYQIDLPAVLRRLTEEVKLVFICSPNNPTGNSLRPDDIKAILARAGGLVVIDEAYADFNPGESFASQLGQYPNLVVLQTFSKAWGLAGLRLGMLFSSADLVALLNKIKPPYNISSPAQELALGALANAAAKDRMVEQILRQRSVLREQLLACAVVKKVYPSDANFLLVKVEHPREIYHRLLEQGIVVRDRSRLKLCAGCLRVTVGTPEENLELTATLSTL